MVSLTGFNSRFTPRLAMSILALISALLFIRLGVWQLHRAEEKKNMLHAHQVAKKKTAMLWTPSRPLPTQYEPLRVRGTFISKALLLDNQHHNHQFGYNVISPLLLSNDKVILVDRGWVAGDITRQTHPAIEMVQGEITLLGSVYYPSKKNWRLGPLFEQERPNSVVIELVDTKLIGQFLHKQVYPFIIRLDKREVGGYLREWAIVSMPPERHDAYALQWFVMAFVMVVALIILQVSKKDEA